MAGQRVVVQVIARWAWLFPKQVIFASLWMGGHFVSSELCSTGSPPHPILFPLLFLHSCNSPIYILYSVSTSASQRPHATHTRILRLWIWSSTDWHPGCLQSCYHRWCWMQIFAHLCFHADARVSGKQIPEVGWQINLNFLFDLLLHIIYHHLLLGSCTSLQSHQAGRKEWFFTLLSTEWSHFKMSAII